MYYLKKTLKGYDLIWYSIRNNTDNDLSNPNRQRDYDYETAMRSKTKIIDYGLTNNWTHMITITFDPNKHDRYNYDQLTTKLIKWLKKYKERYDPELKYIIIPELHRSKENEPRPALHFHGLISTTQDQYLKKSNTKRNTENNIHIFEHQKILQAFGFNEFTKIYNHAEFITYYISKYISKSFGQKITNKRFYSSQGLKRPIKYYIEELDMVGWIPNYQNQFISKWTDIKLADLEQLLHDHKSKEKILNFYENSKL